MSIEDINYLKENSIRQSYTFLVDSSSRDRTVHPDPNEYVLEFSTPFRNVIGVEVVDVSIPKTMYNIDYNNNKLYYYIAPSEEENHINIILDNDGNETYDKSIFSVLEIPPGDYNINSFLEKIRALFVTNAIPLDLVAVDTPADITNLLYFRSQRPFILDMRQSTLAELLGFDLYTSSKLVVNRTGLQRYRLADYNTKPGFEKLYHSYGGGNSVGMNTVYAPGMMYLLGDKYVVLKCPEIEEHLYRSLAYSKYNMGLAKIRLNSYGYNDEKTSFLKVPTREFHPIGKLSKMTMRFETNLGELYDFKGVNHNFVIAIYYYEPKNINKVIQSKLNPDYNPNFIEYMYTQDEQDGESDDDEDEFSRDNLQLYKKRELQYDQKGIDNKNIALAYNKKKESDETGSQYTSIQRHLSHNQETNIEKFSIMGSSNETDDSESGDSESDDGENSDNNDSESSDSR
jgi:hypothetical protein